MSYNDAQSELTNASKEEILSNASNPQGRWSTLKSVITEASPSSPPSQPAGALVTDPKEKLTVYIIFSFKTLPKILLLDLILRARDITFCFYILKKPFHL